MKKKLFFISGVIILILLIKPVIHACFKLAMISSSRASSINTEWVKKYKTIIKSDFPFIKDINVYYQYGCVNFHCTVNTSVSLDEYKQVIIKTKDLVKKETISKLYGDQLPIAVKFDFMKYIYVFKCPYWIQSKDATSNQNGQVENDYRIWYLTINNQPEVEIQF